MMIIILDGSFCIIYNDNDDNDNDDGNDNDDDDEATTAYKLLPMIKNNERWILSYCCKK